MRGLTRLERETVIRWDEETKIVHFWSASPPVWRRAARLGLQVVKETTMDGQPAGRWYTVPLGRFRWGLKRQAEARGNPEALRSWRQANRRARGTQNADGGVPS